MSRKAVLPSLLAGALIVAMSERPVAAEEAPAITGSKTLEQRVDELEKGMKTGVEKGLKEILPFGLYPGAEVLYQYRDWLQKDKDTGGDFYVNKFILRAKGTVTDELYYERAGTGR